MKSINTIPKIIHFCWLSSDPFPPNIQKCLDSWKKLLPDYELIHWNFERFPIEKNIWVRQAFEAKKYAFAADYLRLYALYHYGGIYLDTDVEVRKSFNDLLGLPYMLGTEGNNHIEAAVMGFPKGDERIGSCLAYYDDKEFVNLDGTYNMLPLPQLMKKQLERHYTIQTFTDTEAQNPLLKLENDKFIYLFPIDYFCAKEMGTGKIIATERTYAIHHFAMSWISKSDAFLPNLKRRLMSIIGVQTVNKTIDLLGLRKLKKS